MVTKKGTKKPAKKGAKGNAKGPGMPKATTKTEKMDLKKMYPNHYKATTEPQLVDIGVGNYIAIEGQGPPMGKEFQEAVQALYSIAYGVKMRSKFKEGKDYTMAALEGLWWADRTVEELENNFGNIPKEEWKWKALIRQPEFITTEQVERAKTEAFEKKGLVAVKRVNLEKIDEGKSVQILHIGPYANEKESIDRLRAFMKERGLNVAGHHHEIYLSDPRRVAPEKNRTILRTPVK